MKNDKSTFFDNIEVMATSNDGGFEKIPKFMQRAIDKCNTLPFKKVVTTRSVCAMIGLAYPGMFQQYAISAPLTKYRVKISHRVLWGNAATIKWINKKYSEKVTR